MSSIKVTLPEDLEAFVAERVAAGGHRDAGEYIRELIRVQRDRLRLRSLIVEGLESPMVTEAGPDYWAAKRARLLPT